MFSITGAELSEEGNARGLPFSSWGAPRQLGPVAVLISCLNCKAEAEKPRLAISSIWQFVIIRAKICVNILFQVKVSIFLTPTHSILLSKRAQHDKSLKEELWFDMCKGWKKKLPSFYPCPCHPSGKRSGLLPLSLSLFSISSSDERGTMIAATTKGRAARVWMRHFFLLSFLLLYYLSLLTLSDLTYSLFPLHYTPLPLPVTLLLYLSPPDATCWYCSSVLR